MHSYGLIKVSAEELPDAKALSEGHSQISGQMREPNSDLLRTPSNLVHLSRPPHPLITPQTCGNVSGDGKYSRVSSSPFVCVHIHTCPFLCNAGTDFSLT